MNTVGYHQGDQILAQLPAENSLRCAVVAGAITLPLGFLVILVSCWQISIDEPPTVLADFMVFWTAAQFMIEGTPLAALDPVKLTERMLVDPEGWLPFAYPPAFLVFLAPFGFAPFVLAWPLFSAGSAILLLFSLRPWCGASRAIWISAAFAPAIFPALVLGQTTLLWIAILLFALSALRHGNGIAAGILIGLLTFKPQLGLMLPIALIAAGAWRTVLWASITALLMLVLPLFWLGFDYIPTLINSVHAHFGMVARPEDTPHRMMSISAFLLGIGIQIEMTTGLQWISTLGVALIVWIAWQSNHVGADARDAILLAAIPLSTPYLWYYELVIPAAALLFLLRAGRLPKGVFGGSLFLGLWLGGCLMIMIELIAPLAEFPTRFIFVPLIVALFAQAAMSGLGKKRMLGGEQA
ncbi:MAG: glycosyltransferase family 87 protein [Pseudomonadota bacterium]